MSDATPSSTQDPRAKINSVIRLTSVLGVVETVLAVFYFRDVPIPLGIFLGGFLAVLSFILLAKILTRWISNAAKSPAQALLLIFGKFALIALVFWISFGVLKADIYGFLIGYANLPLAITISGMIKN